MPLKVPPQGPFRIFFGQVIGQTYSISPRTQLPQAWQPNSGALIANSTRSRACAAAGRSSTQLDDAGQESSQPVSSCLTGKSCAIASETFGSAPAASGREAVASK